MNVAISERETGRRVAIYPVSLRGQNYSPSQDEFFDEAWRCAVDDGLVMPDRRDKYSFEIAER